MSGITKQQSRFTIRTISGAFALAAILAGGAGIAQAADSNDRIVPPNPADVAMLRSLLALQHPALRNDTTASVSTAPEVVAEPAPSGQTS